MRAQRQRVLTPITLHHKPKRDVTVLVCAARCGSADQLLPRVLARLFHLRQTAGFDMKGSRCDVREPWQAGQGQHVLGSQAAALQRDVSQLRVRRRCEVPEDCEVVER